MARGERHRSTGVVRRVRGRPRARCACRATGGHGQGQSRAVRSLGGKEQEWAGDRDHTASPGRRKGAWYWWALPSPRGEGVPLQLPLPTGTLEERGSQTCTQGRVCRPGNFTSLSRVRYVLSFHHTMTNIPTATLTRPQEGVDGDNVGTGRPSPLEPSCPSPLSLQSPWRGRRAHERQSSPNLGCHGNLLGGVA